MFKARFYFYGLNFVLLPKGHRDLLFLDDTLVHLAQQRNIRDQQS